MNRLLFVMWMSGMLFLSSCSIKEDRDVCPCWMTVDLSDVAESRWKSPESRSNVAENVLLRLRGNSDEDEVGYSYQVTEAVKPDVGALEYEVPRGSVGVSAVALGNEIPGRAGYDGKSARYDGGMPDRVGHDGIVGYDGDEIRVPVSEQMDSLYGFFKMYHTRCESVLCDVELHKEFCTVSFTLGEDGYSSPYRIEVWGNVAGVSAWDLMPVLGEFRYAPMQKNGVYRVRVPRQVDNSLELVMLEIPDQVGYDGEEIPGQVGYDGERAGDDGERVVVDRLPLGEYIARSGYDWTAEDLDDVNVALDLEMQQVMITVSGWDGVVVMDIVI
ncbi:MAG: hypothetical protein IKY16_10865 [Bacteroidales bacterium]|nr:hypothetical protein [Bacteroidales bacterium]